jgi:hypothetical protein
MPEAPTTPMDVFCRGCSAKPGHKCGVVPNRSLLRRRIRDGNPVQSYWIRLLPYFHDMRWRDFNRVRNEYAKLDDWQKRYPAKTEVA